MATTVRFAEDCKIEFGEHTEDRWLIFREVAKAIMELLGTTAGLPGDARRVLAATVDRYVLEEANWKVIYVRTESAGPLSPSIVVTIEHLRLKRRLE